MRLEINEREGLMGRTGSHAPMRQHLIGLVFGQKSPGRDALLCLLVVIAGCLVFAAPAEADSGDALRQATGAVRVEWRSRGETFPSEGMAFFIHPDGYLLTCLDVVEDPAQVGAGQRSSSRLLLLTFAAFGNEIGPKPAKLVASDRNRKLALLKVDMEAPAWLPLAAARSLDAGDPIWVFDGAKARQNSVTGIYRDERNRASGYATDIEPWNAARGGAIIGQKGEVVGLRRHDRGAAGEVTVAVPGKWVRDFVARSAVDLTFSPVVITDFRQLVELRLRPMMVHGVAAGGSASLELAGARVEEALVLQGDELVASLPLPVPSHVPADEVKEARLKMTLEDEAGRHLWERRIKIDVIADWNNRAGTTQTLKDGQMREIDLGRAAQGVDHGGAASQDTTSSLAQVAGSVNLKKQADGTARIDDSAVREYGDIRPDPARYEKLADAGLRSLAERFDIAMIKLERTRNTKRVLDRDPQADRNRKRELVQEREALVDDLSKIALQVQQASICRCYSRVWSSCETASCDVTRFLETLEHFAGLARDREIAQAISLILGIEE